MNIRQKEVQQAHLNNEKAVLEKLKESYQDALDDINQKIELLLARQDADMQHVIYQVEYQEALKKQVSAILDRLQTVEFETVSEYLTKSYEEGFLGTMYDLQGQGIPLIFPIDQRQVTDAVLHDTKLSVSLYSKMGKDIHTLKELISSEISRGIASAAMYAEIARNISAYANIPQNNAMRIARTESHRIQCRATIDAQLKAKEKGADVVKQWDSTLDDRTRESHKELDGQIRELEDEFEINGHKAMYPGGFGIASEDINCRCAILQKAKWNLGSSSTKWSRNAPVKISDDGTTQFVIIKAKGYNSFKEKYRKIVNDLNTVFVPAKALVEAKEYARIVLGVEYDALSTRKMDLDVANEINRTILQYQNEFSKAGIPLTNIREVSADEKFYAAYSHALNTMLLKNVDSKNVLEDMEEYAKKQNLMGWWSTGDAMSAIRHELGHSVGYAIATEEKRTEISRIRKEILSKVTDTDETIFINYREAGKTYQDYLDATKRAGQYISGYALVSDKEMIAECISEYMAGNPRETAKRVVEILKGGG